MIRAAGVRLLGAPPVAVAAVLAGVHLVAAALAFDPTPHSGGDNAAYLALAESLLERGRYLQTWDPAAPPHVQYPPGFPALLAAAMAVGIEPWVGLKALMVMISGLAVALSYLWMRERAGAALALGAGLLVALSPGVVRASHWILSDVPFWAATMGALWLAARDRSLAAAGLAFAALLLRTAGLPLVLGVAVWLFLRRRRRQAAAVLGLLAILAGAWLLRARGAEGGYAGDFWLDEPYAPEVGTIDAAGLLGRALENGQIYAYRLFMDLLSGAQGLGPDLVGAAIIGLAVAGWAVALRRAGLAEIFLPLYLGMILVWPPTWADSRFLLPVLPVLLLLGAEGADLLRGLMPQRSRRLAPRALRLGGLAVLLVMATVGLAREWRWGARCREGAALFPSPCLHPELRVFIGLADAMEGRLPPDAAVLSRKPTFFFWFAGVPGRTYPFTTRPGALFDEAHAAGAPYVVLDRLGAVSTTYLLPVVADSPERFCAMQVFRLEGRDAALLGILPAAEGGGPTGELPAADGGGAVAEDLVLPVCPASYFATGEAPPAG